MRGYQCHFFPPTRPDMFMKKSFRGTPPRSPVKGGGGRAKALPYIGSLTGRAQSPDPTEFGCETGMIRECTAADAERIKRWTEAEGGRSLFWLAMLDDITAEVILEEAVWRIAGRDGQLERRGCSSFLRQQ